MGKFYKCNFFKVLFLQLFLICFSKSWGQTSNLFISEYVEGSSNNKYLEIYNGTGATVNLSNYVIRLFANGASTATSSFTLSGTLATCSVCVIANPSATLAVTPNLTSGVIAFTGNDAVTLETTSGTILDVFGNISCDPGTAWTSGTLTTQDKTLVRKASVCVGNSDEGGNCPFTALGTEWTQFNQNVVSNLGAHTITCASCVGCTPPTTTVVPTTQTICTNVTTTISVSSSATSPTYQWQASANGTTGWANVTNGTPAGVTYGGATSASLTVIGTSTVQYYYQCLVTESGTCTATSGTATLVISTTAPSISTQPYDAVITTAQTATYSVVGSGSPSNYQWQVNSGAGFSNVTNGGVYSGATTTLLTITNPPASMNSYSYQCVLTYVCGASTSSTAVLYVSTPSSSNCPQMTGTFINACNGTCSEGDNEILFFNSGSASIPVSPANIIVSYGSVSSPTTTYTDGFTTNAAYTASLNAMSSASCTTLFIDAMATGTIPANSVFMILRNTACFTFDFSSFCPANTVYVLYSTDISWQTGGNYTNGGSVGELRHFTSNFSAVAGGCTTNYNYQPNYLVGGDGASISFIDGGGAANAYFNNGCTPPALVLPVQLLDFYGLQNRDKNDLIWKVAEEKDIAYYIIEKSNDGVYFEELEQVSLNSHKSITSQGYKKYSISDMSPYKDITYYRLSTKELNGKINRYGVVYVDGSEKKWDYTYYQQEEDLMIEFKNIVPKNASLSLYDIAGQKISEEYIQESITRIPIKDLSTGIYFVKIASPYKTENFKVIISK